MNSPMCARARLRPASMENIQAEVYGSMMRIRDLASISTPEPRMLVIQPWDVGALQPI